FFAELLEVLEKEAFLHGRCIMFFNSQYSTRTEKIYFNECINHNVDGVFLVPSCLENQHLKQLKEFNFPTVLLTKPTSILPSVCCDHEDGGKQVAEHLLSLGHTKIGYIGPINDNEEKLTGFTRHLIEQLEPLQPEYMFDHGDGAEVEGFLKGLIDANGDIAISAIFCMNDVLAQSVIEILNRHGIRTPEDVTVIGFDNSLIAKLMNISSVSQPMKEIAHLGFEIMLEELKQNKSNLNYQSKMLKPRLVRRNSIPETIHK
ncbi:LacI family transcriptional regulator, partial [Vibrio cholerae]|nr:LacI family transcriptional regulator [Vibrio cholerae]